MGRIKMVVLTAMLLSVVGAAEAQRGGTVQGGAQRTFSVSDLTNDRLGRIVASSNYQVSLVLPAEVQNVGINANKQAALVPTVDKSDGRVMYLDVLKPGGYATLNIRLVSEGEPVILKLTVELSEVTSGVLTYTITPGPQPQATQGRPPRTAAPIPAPRATAAPVRPAAAAAPTGAAPVLAPNVRPRSADEQQAPSVQAPDVQAASTLPRLPQPDKLSARPQDGLHVEVSVAPGQSGSDRTVTYHLRDVLGTGKLVYILAPRVTVRASGQSQAQSITTAPNVYRRVTPSGIQGTFIMPASALSAQGPVVVLFEVRPVDTRVQKPLATRYVGVVVRP